MANNNQDNFFTGWVKIYRSLKDKGWYQKSEYVHLWIHLLLKANHKGKEYFMNGVNIKIERGQLVTGRKKLSIETGIPESKVQRILKCFENEQQIEQQTNSRNRVITIVSYNQYQQSEQLTEQPVNNKRTASEQLVNTNKNVKELKNEENLRTIPTEIEFLEHAKESCLKANRNYTELEFPIKSKYEAWVSAKWKDGNDKKIKNWKTKFNNTLPYLKAIKQNDNGQLNYDEVIRRAIEG